MSHNITVESGKSIRLLTSGKYCDRDIIVTATGGGSTDDSIVGTWVLKEILDLYEFGFSTWFVYFDENGNEILVEDIFTEVSPNYTDLYYLDENGNESTVYNSTSGWSESFFRKILIPREPTDTEFITWLKANAVKQIPMAYTVSSVDELPSDAVDGSMAIVESDDLNGWWEFKPELTQPDGEIWVGFEVLDFDGNLYSMKKITQEERGDGFDLLYVRNSDEYETLFAYEYYNDEGSSWGFFAYRRLKVDTSINTPTTSQEQWIRENAKKLKSLYTRENGEWVYKCEIA